MDMSFLKTEIEEVEPTHLIFFTGHDYDRQIQELLNLKYQINDQSDDEIKIWWTKKLENNKNTMQVLRTYHPHYFHYCPNIKELFYQ